MRLIIYGIDTTSGMIACACCMVLTFERKTEKLGPKSGQSGRLQNDCEKYLKSLKESEEKEKENDIHVV